MFIPSIGDVELKYFAKLDRIGHAESSTLAYSSSYSYANKNQTAHSLPVCPFTYRSPNSKPLNPFHDNSDVFLTFRKSLPPTSNAIVLSVWVSLVYSRHLISTKNIV